ncbi:glycosyltransferase family 2 protein [Vibrio parahaemolyticus]|uniref:glycosyltransferase family 2 protein n=1 Tax=Vibrio parahaemolyticus TaxID=670 RepID=UPI00226A6595|nr:glycosyltransferase family 2 protein [Vibrio parahaemolyticus]MCX8778681.1 glycosyltransferase [Vibrio parahaemolyticus]
MKGSIVIPCYNVEKYIVGMLDSLFKDENINEWLVILIDDGSTDQTYKILCEYKKNNVNLIKQENKGQSKSRNIGLEYSEGEFIIFLDADDIVSENYISNLYNVAQESNCDMVVGNIYSLDVDGNIDKYNSRNYLVDDFKTLEGCNSETISKFLQDRLSVSPCNKLIRKSILSEPPFLCGYINEDMLFAFDLFYKKINIKRCEKATYYYVSREGSTTKRNDARILDMYHVLNEIKKSDTNDYISSIDWAYYYVKFGVILTLNRSRKSCNTIKLKIIKQILNDLENQKFKDLYKSCESIKQKIVIIVLKSLSKMKSLIFR